MLEYKIDKEDSSIHWKYFNCKDKNVIDLGCSRWGGSCNEEYSPIWIYNNGANKVIGIDDTLVEINFMKSITEDKSDKFNFICEKISSVEQIKQLLATHDINAIKCDIEGTEKLFLDFKREDFDNINVFAVEYHNHQLKADFMQKLPEWGFNIIAHGALYVDGMGVLFGEK